VRFAIGETSLDSPKTGVIQRLWPLQSKHRPGAFPLKETSPFCENAPPTPTLSFFPERISRRVVFAAKVVATSKVDKSELISTTLNSIYEY
jgi:hypothetical protein